jgi:hypothetical protein
LALRKKAQYVVVSITKVVLYLSFGAIDIWWYPKYLPEKE